MNTHSKSFFRLHSTPGFSLIEMLLVLGVLAVLLIAAFVVYPTVRAKNQAAADANNILIAQTNIRNLFASRGGSYAGLGGGKQSSNGPDKGIANLAKVFPATMNGGDYSKNATVSASWGGEVWVWSRPVVTVPSGEIAHGYSFAMSIDAVPPEICVHLLPALAGQFLSMRINNIEMVEANNGFKASSIGEACVQTGSLTLTSG